MGHIFIIICGFLIYKFVSRNPERKRKAMALISNCVDYISRFLGLYTPLLDVMESDSEFKVLVDLPGMNKDDISAEVTTIETPKGKIDQLIVKGKRKEDESQPYTVVSKGRLFGTFTNTICFSDRVNAAKAVATLKDGVLEIIAPKAKGSTENSVMVPIQ